MGERGIAAIKTGDRLAALDGRYWGFSLPGAGWLRGAMGGTMEEEHADETSGRGGVVGCFLDDDGDSRDGTSTGDTGRGRYDVWGSVGNGGGEFEGTAFGFLADLSLATPRTRPSATR